MPPVWVSSLQPPASQRAEVGESKTCQEVRTRVDVARGCRDTGNRCMAASEEGVRVALAALQLHPSLYHVYAHLTGLLHAHTSPEALPLLAISHTRQSTIVPLIRTVHPSIMTQGV